MRPEPPPPPLPAPHPHGTSPPRPPPVAAKALPSESALWAPWQANAESQASEVEIAEVEGEADSSTGCTDKSPGAGEANMLVSFNPVGEHEETSFLNGLELQFVQLLALRQDPRNRNATEHNTSTPREESQRDRKRERQRERERKRARRLQQQTRIARVLKPGNLKPDHF